MNREPERGERIWIRPEQYSRRRYPAVVRFEGGGAWIAQILETERGPKAGSYYAMTENNWGRRRTPRTRKGR